MSAKLTMPLEDQSGFARTARNGSRSFTDHPGIISGGLPTRDVEALVGPLDCGIAAAGKRRDWHGAKRSRAVLIDRS